MKLRGDWKGFPGGSEVRFDTMIPKLMRKGRPQVHSLHRCVQRVLRIKLKQRLFI